MAPSTSNSVDDDEIVNTFSTEISGMTGVQSTPNRLIPLTPNNEGEISATVAHFTLEQRGNYEFYCSLLQQK